MIRNILILTLLVLACCGTSKRTPEEAVQKLGANPYFEIDGKSVTQSELGNYNPTDIASLTTFYDKDAKKRFGEKAKDGAVIIETKEFATNRYETFFKSYSKDYEKMLNETQKEEIQYILNDRILTENYEGDLASIDKNLIKEIKIIDQKELIEKYQIQNKKVGVIIKADAPKNLYNAKEKF